MAHWFAFIGAGLAVLVAPAAEAQSAPPATTMLHLSGFGAIATNPDELVANLLAKASAPSDSVAQRQVNLLVADGIKASRAVKGLDARTIGYLTRTTDEKHSVWTAEQTLELHDADGDGLLDLAGKLQDKGFAMTALGWRVSSALGRKAHEEAVTAALKDVQSRAASAAATLGLHVDHIEDIRLDGQVFQPRMVGREGIPLPSPASPSLARPAIPPQATSTPEEVTATVQADVVLRP